MAPVKVDTATKRTELFLHLNDLFDVTIVAGFEGHEVTFPAHRLVLAAVSPVLKQLLYEDATKVRDQVLKMPDEFPRAVQALLHYAYTGEWEPDESLVGPLLRLANRYAMSDLAAALADYIAKDVTVDNCLDRLEILLSGPILSHAAQVVLDFVAANASVVLLKRGIANLSVIAAKAVFSQSAICLPEVDVFNAAMRYAVGRCLSKAGRAAERIELAKKRAMQDGAGGDVPDAPRLGLHELREALLEGDVLREIRFTRMPHDVFSKSVVPLGILTKDEVIAVYSCDGDSYVETRESSTGFPFNTAPRGLGSNVSQSVLHRRLSFAAASHRSASVNPVRLENSRSFGRARCPYSVATGASLGESSVKAFQEGDVYEVHRSGIPLGSFRVWVNNHVVHLW